MNANGNEAIRLRKVRPIHYIAPAASVVIFGALIPTFGMQTAIWFLKAIMIFTCTVVGLYSLQFGLFAYRVGSVRTGLGIIERDKRPVVFWMLLLSVALSGPLLVGCCLVLTRGW